MHDELGVSRVVQRLQLLFLVNFEVDLTEKVGKLVLSNQVGVRVVVLKQTGHLTETDGLAPLIILVEAGNVHGVEAGIRVLVVQIPP